MFRVVRFCRRTRRTLEVHAEGLTMHAASHLAAALRKGDLANESNWGYGLQTMPLHEQARLLAANEAMQLAA